MMRRFSARHRLLVIACAGASIVATTASAGAGGGAAPEVRVAIFASGACGPFAESLPQLVARGGIHAGEAIGDVTVCVTNAGHTAGALYLGVAERVEVDSRCSGEEADADATCASGAAGELGPALVQQIGADRCSRVGPPVALSLERRLPELESPVLLAHRLTPDHVVCVRLRLRYAPADAAALVASQSDSTSWRYGFDLTSAK